MESITRYYASRGIALGECALVRGADKAELAGAIALCPPSALNDLWTRRFPDPVDGLRVRLDAGARARAPAGVELPLVISDHADWDGLTATIAATGAGRNLGHARPGGRAGALVRDARPEGAAARYRRLWRGGRRRREKRQKRGEAS